MKTRTDLKLQTKHPQKKKLTAYFVHFNRQTINAVNAKKSCKHCWYLFVRCIGGKHLITNFCGNKTPLQFFSKPVLYIRVYPYIFSKIILSKQTLLTDFREERRICCIINWQRVTALKKYYDKLFKFNTERLIRSFQETEMNAEACIKEDFFVYMCL